MTKIYKTENISSKYPPVQIEFLNDSMVRIQILPGGTPHSSALNRYGFITPPAASEFQVQTAQSDTESVFKTEQMTLRCSRSKPEITITNAGGETLLHQVDFSFHQKGASVLFQAHAREDWVGFGDQTRERLYHRGYVADCHVVNVRSYIPVPFFMSTLGAGVLVNTTHRVVFDMCKSDADHFSWTDRSGAIDYYVMAGHSFRDLIAAYTGLTGKPKLPPVWSFGLWYICRTQANDVEVVNDALNFRREEIPCDVIGLEPGWLDQPAGDKSPSKGWEGYNESTTKWWNHERFPIPSYNLNGPHNFFNALKRMGYRMELWQCCDYDFSYEEERQLGAAAVQGDTPTPACYHPGAEVDEHFAEPRYLYPHTKRNEAWFEHLKKFVDQGAEFFKQDGAFQMLDHPDRMWGNGMSDQEMHNLYCMLYVRQMYRGLEAHTGRRALTFTPCGWTGFQAWAGTWTGDTGGRIETLGAMLNTAMLGHSWMTNDMEVAEKEGMHFGYLLPWSQINSWNYFRMPWIQGRELAAMHKDYSRLRSRLVPYIYAWAYQASRTGFPLMVPLTLEFEDDHDCRAILHQFLLGRDLMVTAYKPEVYFPTGRWKDYWTGTVIDGRQRKTISWPANRGGGLFIRGGAIIPLGPVMQYRGEIPLDEVELYVFPVEKKSAFTFYEDDGTSLAYRNGQFATTEIEAVAQPSSVIITVAQTKGVFTGQPENRRWGLRIAVDFIPRHVGANGKELESNQWRYDNARQELCIAPRKGPVTVTIT